MLRATALEQLLRSTPQLWTANQRASVRARDTGFAALNQLLPGSGWPQSSLIEFLPSTEGIGEMQLIVPVLKQLCSEARDIVFVHPPHVPYPPALHRAGLLLNRIIWIDPDSDEDARWAAEQTLRQGVAGAVVLWSDCTKEIALRRLQLAAREAESIAFLYRSPGMKVVASPAAVRLALAPSPSGLHVDLLKVQGGRAGHVTLPLQEAA